MNKRIRVVNVKFTEADVASIDEVVEEGKDAVRHTDRGKVIRHAVRLGLPLVRAELRRVP